MLRSLPWLLLTLLMACQPTDMPLLELTASPRTIDGRGGTSTISVNAYRREGVPGTGTVRLSSTAGSFSPPVTVSLDANGKATESFTCITATEPACITGAGRAVTITADWLHNDVAFTAETRVTISVAGGGAAGGGAAGGGSTGGGAAGGGSTGGGSTGGGSTGGGATGGGSAGGGSTGGGSTAGGGASGGGTTGGGAAGGGMADGGTDGGFGRISDPIIDPSHVILFGTLTNRSCEGAFAQLDAGTTRPFVGVPCGANPLYSWLRPDGGFVYRHPTSSRVIHAVADPLAYNSRGWQYPMNVDANDLDLTPGCTGVPSAFRLRPNGAVVAKCADGSWMEGSATLPPLLNEDVIAFGLDGAALVNRAGNLFLISTAGVQTPVAAPFLPEARMTRANAAGFLSVATMPSCSLYQIANDGTVTKVGDYTTASSIGTIVPACNGRIDATGTLFFGITTIGSSSIVRRPLTPGTMTWAFPANTTSTVWDFGPRFNLVLLDGNGIVSSP